MFNRLRQIRHSKDLSLLQLQELSGVSWSQISHIERGNKVPKADTLCKLAKALNVGLEDIWPCN